MDHQKKRKNTVWVSRSISISEEEDVLVCKIADDLGVTSVSSMWRMILKFYLKHSSSAKKVVQDS